MIPIFHVLAFDGQRQHRYVTDSSGSSYELIHPNFRLLTIVIRNDYADSVFPLLTLQCSRYQM
jgi:hypothetical protein